jgi:sec-independent protein translocase protein TatA
LFRIIGVGGVMHIGATEIIVILVLFFLLFGAKKLPEAARSFAKSLKIFKKEMHSVSEDFKVESDEKQDENEVPEGPSKQK